MALSACGGGDSTPPKSNMFVADSAYSVIGGFTNANPKVGDALAPRVMSGEGVGLQPTAMEVDGKQDILYVANLNGLLAIDHAGSAQGAVSPRVVNSTVPSALYFDRINNRLYAAGQGGAVLVYNGLTPGLSSVSATRTLAVQNMSTVLGVAVDVARDLLYVYGYDTAAGGFRINVYTNASTIGAAITPARVINLGVTANTSDGFALDDVNDTLYVAAGTSVYAVTNASAASGTLSLGPLFAAGTIGLKLYADSVNQRLYAVSGNYLYIMPGMSWSAGVAAGFSGADLSAVAVRR